MLERFMGDSASTSRVRDIFTGLYSLDFDESGERAVEMALADAEKYVSCFKHLDFLLTATLWASLLEVSGPISRSYQMFV